jgi:hypothetical protein
LVVAFDRCERPFHPFHCASIRFIGLAPIMSAATRFVPKETLQ